MDFKNLLAKSNGETLVEHLINTAEKCEELARKVTSNEQLIALSYLSGLLHDIGKATDEFQSYVTGKIEKQEYLHQNVSYEVIHNKLSVFFFDFDYAKEAIETSILFHHPLTTQSYISEDIYNETMSELINFLVSKYNSKFGNISKISVNDDIIWDENDDDKTYLNQKISSNSKIIFLSSILRFADILDSNKSINADDFITLSNLYGKLEKPAGYDERFDEQQKYSNICFNNHISMFDCQTGFGKTMLGLLYILHGDKKGYWICPRNSIATGVYETIIKEVNALNVNISVGLLLAGSFIDSNDGNKDKYNDGELIPDIIVTNIDNFTNPFFKTSSNIRNFTIVNSTCIFDEFHEYLTDAPIMATYMSIMRCRKDYCTNSKTLLISATSEKGLYNKYVDKSPDSVNILDSNKIRNKKINIKYVDKPDCVCGSDELIYTNTVEVCQAVKQAGLCDKIVHARYTEEDKREHLEELLQCHGKSSTNRNVSYVGTSVIGTGIDVSFKSMVIYFPTPNTLRQVLGRCNRWFENEEASDITIIFNKNSRKKERVITDNELSKELCNSFESYLKENLSEGEHTLGDIYDICKSFRNNNDSKYSKVIKDKMKVSGIGLSKIDYKYSSKKEAKNSNEDIVISDANSIRCVGQNKIFLHIANSEMADKQYMQVEYCNDTEEASVPAIIKYSDMKDGLKSTIQLVKERKYMNKYARKNTFTDELKSIKHLIQLAKHSDTPYLMEAGGVFNYTKELGLIKK